MSQPNMGSEGGSRASARGAVASKSHEAAQRIESKVAEGVERVRSQADDAKDQAAERIRRVAGQLRNMSESLRTDDAIAANLAAGASRQIESVAAYVSSSDARTLIRDTEQLARRQPALFFGGAFLLGLAAGRFLKSSAPPGPRYRYRGEQQRFDYSRDDYDDAQDDYAQARDEAYDDMQQPGWTRTGNALDRPARHSSSQDRYQQNFDAAFGRDVGTGQSSSTPGTSTPGTSTPGASTSSSYTSGTSTPNTGTGAGRVPRASDRAGSPSRGSDASIEPNGIIDPTKGKGS